MGRSRHVVLVLLEDGYDMLMTYHYPNEEVVEINYEKMKQLGWGELVTKIEENEKEKEKDEAATVFVSLQPSSLQR